MSEHLAFKSAGAVPPRASVRADRGTHGVDCRDPQPGNCLCGAVNPESAAAERAGTPPTVAQIAKIIGQTPNDLDDEGCDAKCETDGGTCICVELYSLAAQRIADLFNGSR